MTARLDIHRTNEGGTDQVPLKAGTNRVKVTSGRQFRLVDADRELNADTLRVLQIDTDMVIENIPLDGGGETATVILEDYYKVCSATDRCEVAAEGAGGPVPLADVDTKALGALADGTFVLHDTRFQAPEAPPTADNEFPVRPVLYGLGGAAVLGLALGGGGGGGDDGAPTTGDIPLALKSATSFNNRFPTISGTAQPGTEIQLRLDTDGDLRENVTYTTTADAAGNWSVNLQTATAATGALPATGLADSNSLSVIGTLNGVQNSLPLTTLTFDNISPAAAVIEPVAEDGIITGPEKAAGARVSGTAEANGSVEIRLGETTKLVTVGPDGKWETTLGAAELPAADGQHTMTVTAIDAAGNRGPAATTSVVLSTVGTAAAIGVVAGNDIINAAEAASPIAIGGTAEAGSTVQVTLGTATQTITAGADGRWNASLALPAGLADGRHDISVETTNAAGNKATTTRGVTLDRTAPANATGITIGDGDTITHAESRNGTTVSGRAEAGATVSVAWNNHTETATVGSDGQWQVFFTAAQIPVPDSGSQQSTIAVSVQDAARNTSGTVNTAVTVQGPVTVTAPVINTITPDNRIDATEAGAPVTVTGRADPGTTVTLTVGAITGTATTNTSGEWSTTLDLGSLPNGSHTLSASAASPGASASASGTHSFTVDKGAASATGPTISGLTISDGPEVTAAEAANGFTVSGRTTAGASVSVTLNDGTAKTATAGANGQWSVEFAAADLPTVAAGQTASATISATATLDGTAGTAATQALTIQGASATTSPAAALDITSISGNNAVTATEAASAVPVIGTAPAGATVSITLDGNPVGTTTANASGAWTHDLTIPATALPGLHTLGVSVGTGGTGSTDTQTFTLSRTVGNTTTITTTPGGATVTTTGSTTAAGEEETDDADETTVNVGTPALASAGTAPADSVATRALSLDELLSDSQDLMPGSTTGSTPAPTPSAAPATGSATTLDALLGSQPPWETGQTPLQGL